MALQIGHPTASILPSDEFAKQAGAVNLSPVPLPAEKIVQVVNNIFKDLTDPIFWGPMFGAQKVFGLSRFAFVRLLSPHISRGASLLAANSGAFALEGLGFVGLAHGLRYALKRKSPAEESFAQELGYAYLGLGLLKSFGGMVQTGLRLHYKNIPTTAFSLQEKIIVHSAPHAAQFAGIFLGHTLAPGFGLGQELDLAERAFQSLVSVVHFGMAGYILAGFPGYARFNQRMQNITDRWIEKPWEENPFKNLNFFPRRTAPASGAWVNNQGRWKEGSEDPKLDNIFYIKDHRLMNKDLYKLPDNLPVPVDDGATSHLKGMTFPNLTLPATDGSLVNFNSLPGKIVIFIYPMTGRPGVPLPNGWDAIPGARGCNLQACGFRDHFANLKELNASIFGLSTQTTAYQMEVHNRLHLPYQLLSDVSLQLKTVLRAPTFIVDGMELYKRHTLILENGKISKVFYPIFPPDQHADEVLAWLQTNS